MDLVSTVRKEGSRGGRGEFQWSDVQASSHRENYLGHSLMAPVGRWQKGKDLNWYAKADAGKEDGEDPVEKAARERKEEIRKIKEAEQDALAKALGFDVVARNPNMEALGDKKEVDKLIKEAADEEGDGGRGVGFGVFSGANDFGTGETDERLEGNVEQQDAELARALKEYRRRHGNEDRRRRSRSRSKERRRDKQEGHRSKDGHRRRRSRSVTRHHRRRSRSRSKSRDGRRTGHNEERRYRSRSPGRSKDQGSYRDRKQHHRGDDGRRRDEDRRR